MDIDTIEPGIDFVEVIETAISQCDILLVLIGKQWVRMTDTLGRRRLDNPEDFVLLEVKAGLERNIRVIPVLVGGATMPNSQELPAVLINLARRNAFEISDARWHTDVGRLIEVTEKIVASQQIQEKSSQIVQEPPVPEPQRHATSEEILPQEKPLKAIEGPRERRHICGERILLNQLAAHTEAHTRGYIASEVGVLTEGLKADEPTLRCDMCQSRVVFSKFALHMAVHKAEQHGTNRPA